MLANKVFQHPGVSVGVQQDARGHRVESGVQRVASCYAGQADVGRAGSVPLAQHDAAQVVLSNQGQVAAEMGVQASRN
ncbi:hypothetical protein [Streptomyces scopuliridis]|uniref:hypothetical protein n=1 Tax=Streptomyces scopuliridis TaxID=452529 RepID=UPI002DDC35AA|nr:hypothetical protein [Streptomyces scopuliridis]